MVLLKVGRFFGFKSVDEILKGDYSNKSYWTVPRCGIAYITLHKVVQFADEISSTLMWFYLCFNFFAQA